MSDWLVFIRLFQPYQGRLLVGTLLMLIVAVASIVLLSLAGGFITAAAVAGPLAPDGVAVAFNFMQPAAEIRALAIIRTLGRYAERLITHDVTFRVLAAMRTWLFRQLLPLALGPLALQRSGDLLNHATHDIDALEALYLRIVAPLVVGGLVLAGAIGLIYCYSQQLAWLDWILVVIAALGIPMLCNRFAARYAERALQQIGELKNRQLDLLQGLADVLSGNAYPRFERHVLAASRQLLQSQQRFTQIVAVSTAVSQWLAAATIAATVWIVALLCQNGQLTATDAAGLTFATLALFEVAWPMTAALHSLPKTAQAMRRIVAVTLLPSTIEEPLMPKQLPLRGTITLQQVCFRYPGQARWLLHDVNLHLQPGDKIAVIGPSGAGKTSLLHLLLHFFDPQQGHIRFAGSDYRQCASADLHRRIGLLSQHSRLFAGTIADNLRLAKVEATDSELYAALAVAGLIELLNKLPDGLQTWLGENGRLLSGGESRRLALARLSLQNAPIVLLDEPTEGLDAETEQQVLIALQRVCADKTVVTVTHRRTALSLAERVYRLDEGRLQPCLDKHE